MLTDTEAMEEALNGAGYEVTDISWPYMPETHWDVSALEADELISNDPYMYIVDVREKEDFCGQEGHIPEAENYPWASGVLEKYYKDFPEGSAVLLVSGDGSISHQAAVFLENRGLYVYDMAEGMSGWLWETELCETSEPDDFHNEPSEPSEPDYENGDGGGGGCFIQSSGFGIGAERLMQKAGYNEYSIQKRKP